MLKPYKHLNRRERDRIAVLHARGISLRAIATELDRSPGTVSREIRRNRSDVEYLPGEAHRTATDRWRHCHQRPRLKDPSIVSYVRRKLRTGWSPEQVAGRMALETGSTISHEAIYQWIYTEARELIDCLHRGRSKRVPRRYRKHTRPRIPGRTSILERPAAVETRAQSGHWEVDTIASRGGVATLVILTERKTRLVKLSYLVRKTALGVDAAIVRKLNQYPSSLRRTLTYDNGTENSQHRKTNATLGTLSYFCHPHHAWEKGTVENSVGLVRRFFPKGTNFDKVTTEEVRWVERRLNRRPRKCLQFLTPNEAFRLERCT